jgi:general secretion pathway protein H
MKSRGFSLIELIVVLIILSLSISLVFPSLSRFSKAIELKGTVKKVSAILRHCRSEAVNKGKVYQVLIDSDLRQARVQSLEEMGEDEKREEKIQKKIYQIPDGIQINEALIEFYPNGGSNGGSILFSSQNRKGYKIEVHFLTGMVKVEVEKD